MNRPTKKVKGKDSLVLSRIVRHVSRVTNVSGFTLVELMIAIVIGVIILGATYATYISQQRSFIAQDQVAEMNSTSKVSLDMIANDIRETGFGIPEDISSYQRTPGCFGINGFTQNVNFTDGGTNGADQITLIGGFRLVGNISAPVVLGSTTVTLTDTAELKSGGSFQPDKGYISIGGISFAVVTNIVGNTLTLNRSLEKSFPAGVPVYLVENVTYQTVFDATDNRWELRKIRRMAGPGCATNPDTDVIAEQIEDLQFVLLDIHSPADGVNERIRVNLLARTSRADPNFRGQGNPPATGIENRTVGSYPSANDDFRRRWWQMEVELRNQI